MKCKCGGTVTYQGLNSIECDNPSCDNYREPDEDITPTEYVQIPLIPGLWLPRIGPGKKKP